MTPFPKDDDFDYNPQIDEEIEGRLFGKPFAFREMNDYEEPYELPDRDYKDFEDA